MTRFGKNLKLSVHPDLRADVRRFWGEGLGGAHAAPREDLDQFRFFDGAAIGVFYTPDVLPEDAWAAAPWLEFFVDEDPEAVAARLVELGGVRVAGLTAHPYVRAPGGPVFRLARE